jgi:integrase
MITLIQANRQTDKPKQGAAAGLSPSAQSPGLCELGKFVEQENGKVRGWLERNENEAVEIKALIALMWENGLRVSEALGISEYDILHNNRIRVKGAKGSNTRYVTPVAYRDVWFDEKLRMPVYLRHLSRFYVYRLCKRYGFYYSQLGEGNSKVTHYFRYLYMLTMKLDDLNERERAELIGHKNVKSQLYYYDKNLKQI